MKLLRNPVVVGILAAVAVIVVVYQFMGPKIVRALFGSKSAAPAPAAAQAQPAPAPVASAPRPVAPAVRAAIYTNLEDALLPAQGVEAALIEPRFKTWVSAPLRDPFLLFQPVTGNFGSPFSETNSPVTTWTLKAIWHQTDSRLAVINGKVYRVGDSVVQGYKLIRIEQDEVWFQGPSRNERLGFRKGSPPPAPPAKPITRNGYIPLRTGPWSTSQRNTLYET